MLHTDTPHQVALDVLFLELVQEVEGLLERHDLIIWSSHNACRGVPGSDEVDWRCPRWEGSIAAQQQGAQATQLVHLSDISNSRSPIDSWLTVSMQISRGGMRLTSSLDAVLALSPTRSFQIRVVLKHQQMRGSLSEVDVLTLRMFLGCSGRTSCKVPPAGRPRPLSDRDRPRKQPTWPIVAG